MAAQVRHHDLVYISALLLFVVAVVLFLWWGAAKQRAVHRAVAVTTNVHERAAESVLRPLEDVVAAAWLEASRWRAQLQEHGIEPAVDRTLNAFAFRAAERFALTTGQTNVSAGQDTVHDLLSAMLDDALTHLQA